MPRIVAPRELEGWRSDLGVARSCSVKLRPGPYGPRSCARSIASSCSRKRARPRPESASATSTVTACRISYSARAGTGRCSIVVGWVEQPGSVYFNAGGGRFHEVRWNDGKGTSTAWLSPISMEINGRKSSRRAPMLRTPSGSAPSRSTAVNGHDGWKAERKDCALPAILDRVGSFRCSRCSFGSLQLPSNCFSASRYSMPSSMARVP